MSITYNEITQNSKSEPKKFSILCTFKQQRSKCVSPKAESKRALLVFVCTFILSSPFIYRSFLFWKELYVLGVCKILKRRKVLKNDQIFGNSGESTKFLRKVHFLKSAQCFYIANSIISYECADFWNVTGFWKTGFYNDELSNIVMSVIFIMYETLGFDF